MEEYIDLWKMSIAIIDLETYMSRPFITAIKRISDGRAVYGNWKTMRNNTARMMWNQNFVRFEEQEVLDGRHRGRRSGHGDRRARVVVVWDVVVDFCPR